MAIESLSPISYASTEAVSSDFAVAGIIQVARFASVDALRGQGMELQAVAAAMVKNMQEAQRA